jgi:hypothetical protein
MERRIEEFVHTDPQYCQPYNNHFGYGNSLGGGNFDGTGRAFIDYYPVADMYTGDAILSYNNNKTYMIDGFVVYITHIHEPWLMGEIIKNDLTTQSCYMAKINDKFVVDYSLREVLDGMREKIALTKDNADDIARAFVLAHPDYEKEYDWEEMVAWHSLDKTSCADGRRNFSKYAKMSSGMKATPKVLIEFMMNSTSKPIAERMLNIYLQQK